MKKLIMAVLSACLLVSLACFAACEVLKPVLSVKDGITSVAPGGSVELLVEVDGKVNPEGTTFTIQHGESYSSIDQATGVLTVKENAVPGSFVTVFAEYSGASTAPVTITVGEISVESIAITATADKIARGGQVTLNATVNPANATEKYEWRITEGGDYATITGNILTVSESAVVGSAVKVKAVCGAVESNELSFAVTAAENVMIIFNADEITVDKRDSQVTKNLVVKTYKNNTLVTDLAVSFEIESGAEFLEIVPDGQSCSLKAKGHGAAVVKATVPGTTAVETATVNVIVPPDSLAIADAFESRNGFNFSFGKSDALEFPVEAVGEGVCRDYEISFSNAAGDENLASYNYEKGEVTFNTTGLITVTATSKSGSKKETSVSYTFDVNDGKNVATFQELKTFARSSSYNGEIINIVNLETDVLVPELVKNPKQGMNLNDMNEERIYVANRNFRLRGNNYTIDTSAARVTKEKEDKIGPIIWIRPELAAGQASSDKTYTVEISDLIMVGNNGFQADSFYAEQNDGTMYYRNMQAIRIGDDNSKAVMYPTLKNIRISGFYSGMRIAHAVNGMLENITVEDCYSNGIEVAASIISVKDATYRNCGAFGIEMTPEVCSEAGAKFNEPQQVTFLGDTVAEIDSSALSPYMANWKGGLVKTLLTANIASYSAEQRANFQAADGKMIFYALKFNNLDNLGKASNYENTTEFKYGNQDNNFTIDAKELTGKDITHRFIVMDVLLDRASAGAVGVVLPEGVNYVSVGQVIFLNLNYVAA